MERETYTALEMEAALCAWEYMLDIRDTAPADHWSDELRARRAAFKDVWEDMGSSAMRSISIQAGAIALATYDLMNARGIEFHSAYDWEFVPGVLCRLDWRALAEHNQYGRAPYKPNVSAILRELMAETPDDFEPTPALSDWLAKARYQAGKVYAYVDLVADHLDRFIALFDAGEEPAAAVREIGTKYDLTPAASW